MNIRVFSYFLLFILFGYNINLTASELTAYEVVEKMDERYDGDTAESEMTLFLINKDGIQRIRQLKTFYKYYGEDKKSVIFFQSPANIKNTAYLIFDWAVTDKEDDSWLYLPALRKVKRIVSSDKSGSFMGSDFSFSDIEGLEISQWNYTFEKKTEIVNGFDTWVITGKPKKLIKKNVIDKTGYLKVKLWIRKDNFIIVKAKYWLKKGKKIKYYNVVELKKIENIWTVTQMKMILTKKGKLEHSTVIIVNDMKYNEKISDNLFTKNNIERGVK